VFTAAVGERLNEHGYILLPGLGYAGDKESSSGMGNGRKLGHLRPRKCDVLGSPHRMYEMRSRPSPTITSNAEKKDYSTLVLIALFT